MTVFSQRNHPLLMQLEADQGIEFSQLGFVHIFVHIDAYSVPGESETYCDAVSFSQRYEVVDAYAPRAESPGSNAIPMEDQRFIAWGEEIEEISYGDNVLDAFRTPEKALGAAQGGSFDVVSLGQGGTITFFFETAIANGTGADFAVFENSFSDLFLELARVEVSSDGQRFVPLPHAYLGQEPVSGFGQHEAELIFSLAGKYRGGYGTPFDLSTLAWSIEAQLGLIDLHAIHYVRVVDIIGDGETYDTFQNPIYDPYPTRDSAGFDIDAIGVIHSSETAPCPSQPAR